MNYTTDEIVEGIKVQDNKVLNYVYQIIFPKIKSHIKSNKGTEEESHDIFQEAIIIVFRKIKNDELVLNCNFETYIFSVCKLLWLAQLKKKKRIVYVDSFENHADDTTIDWDKNDRLKLYQKYYQLLLPDCKKILYLFSMKVPLVEIALIMGHKNEKYTKRKKFLCKERLVKSIKNDIEFKELTG